MRILLSEKWGVIILCWFVYTCSYIGKIGYSANIIQIEKTFDVSHATAGIVSTCFFFAYGAGQIINGIFCKKYNVNTLYFSLFWCRAFAICLWAYCKRLSIKSTYGL